MPRPPCCRRVAGRPTVSVFKPVGMPTRLIEEVILPLDEFEALRLADLEGLYHKEAAIKMGVSRPTFGRILEAARKKVTGALFAGKALRIEGGPVATRRIGEMKICIPIDEDRGLMSTLCSHFGSAPMYAAIEIESEQIQVILNPDPNHAHGRCRPLARLQGHIVDAVIVRGIGRGALTQLKAAGIPVYVSQCETVADAVAAFKAGDLDLLAKAKCCGQHGSDNQTHGCGHDSHESQGGHGCGAVHGSIPGQFKLVSTGGDRPVLKNPRGKGDESP